MNHEDRNLPKPADLTDQATSEGDVRLSGTSAIDSLVEGRRRVLKAAVPAILSIASQSALGAGMCLTPSRSVSRNTSLSQQDQIGTCNGVSPGNYKAQTQSDKKKGQSSNPAYNWPIPTCTAFYSVFAYGPWIASNVRTKYCKTGVLPAGCTAMAGPAGFGTRSMTMLEVLNLQGYDDPNQVAFHVIGAYLNILNGFISDKALTVATLKGMWQEYAQKGYYEPAANVRWYGAAIVRYLSSNYIAP
jgi:hypothetical protein